MTEGFWRGLTGSGGQAPQEKNALNQRCSSVFFTFKMPTDQFLMRMTASFAKVCECTNLAEGFWLRVFG